jgi:hypothetical protein
MDLVKKQIDKEKEIICLFIYLFFGFFFWGGSGQSCS